MCRPDSSAYGWTTNAVWAAASGEASPRQQELYHNAMACIENLRRLIKQRDASLE
eukprot:gene17813-45275_t